MQQDLVSCMLGNVGLDTENHTISDLDGNLVFPFHVIQHREMEIIYTGICKYIVNDIMF